MSVASGMNRNRGMRRLSGMGGWAKLLGRGRSNKPGKIQAIQELLPPKTGLHVCGMSQPLEAAQRTAITGNNHAPEWPYAGRRVRQCPDHPVDGDVRQH